MAASEKPNEDQLSNDTRVDFSSPWNMTDLALEAENEILHVHRCILSLWSPVFNRMLTGDFKEKNAEIIPLPGKSAHEIRQMLGIMYDRRKPITGNEISKAKFTILSASCFYFTYTSS